MKNRGVLLAIEGTDGSGKGTQFNLLNKWLSAAGYEVETFDFPQYGQPSSAAVEEYLNGRYGSSEEVGPYAASLFFAIDRFAAKPAITRALDAKKIVLCNRFTGSNMAHQGTKIADSRQRRQYFKWLHDLEFVKCGLPVPDKSIVLRVPAEIAQKLVDQKEKRGYTDKKRDIHEADIGHLQRSVSVYDELCELFPDEFMSLDCAPEGRLLSIEKVHGILKEAVLDLIKKGK